MTAIFPALPGLAFDVKRRPFFSTRIQTSASGREVRAPLFVNPLWEWDLTYQLLRSDAAHLEWQTLLGFYLQQRGPYTPFYFTDLSDFQLTNQVIATGDGSTTIFPVVRNLGGFVEPVGGINTGAPISLSIGGQAQVAGYAISGNTITFASAPASGAVVAVTLAFYFLARFADDNVELNNFASNFWELRKLTLRSVRS
ncbi:MAG TPA: DUF2460 domain-containing protein [Stellaceae bacterium]|nr:DUF2460 domain-containing protein [Stellaceae bacterium]